MIINSKIIINSKNIRYLSTPIFHNNFNYNLATENQKSYKKQQFEKNNTNKSKNIRKYNSYQNMYKNLPIKSLFDKIILS
jgi:hypothetical protein